MEAAFEHSDINVSSKIFFDFLDGLQHGDFAFRHRVDKWMNYSPESVENPWRVDQVCVL
jgi:hypothetical protein